METLVRRASVLTLRAGAGRVPIDLPEALFPPKASLVSTTRFGHGWSC